MEGETFCSWISRGRETVLFAAVRAWRNNLVSLPFREKELPTEAESWWN